jgi:alpha-amylase/alpha-mannosidase (GH57 family)
MAEERRLTLVLLWHMHQPEYRDPASGEFRMPWVYLHALKDYADMAWHLENHPGVRAVVNFSPVLLEQLEDYAAQFASRTLRDPLLRLLARAPSEAIDEAGRALILRRALAPEHARMGQPFAAFDALRRLFEVVKAQQEGAIHHLSDQYFDDLLVWHHLRWTGETVRRASPVFTRLMATGTHFPHEDRMALVELIGEVVQGVVPRYRRLAESGRIELSTTPHHHPIAPLLLGLESAREALPGAALPQSPAYPGGYGRAGAQLDCALVAHASRFGAPPLGVWPAEGAISRAFLELLASRGCRWTASSAQVLRNSGHEATHRPYRFGAAGGELTVFFRDDRLSDLVGFEYGKWNSHDAAANLIGELAAIGVREQEPVVAVMLDGENCWEQYPYNGFYFLSALYKALEEHPNILTRTCGDCLAVPAPKLGKVVAGSWVRGDFSTWIGSPEKNHAWDLLCAAKQAYDVVVASGRLDAQRTAAAQRALSACEGSDSFWWLDSDSDPVLIAEFDALFRTRLAQLYRLLELPVPAALAQPPVPATRTPTAARP